MKKNIFISLFLLVHLFFVFFYIYKESQIIKLSYQTQKLSKLIDKLTEEKQYLNRTLQTAQNHNQIKIFAQNDLKMNKINLNQIKTLKDEQSA